MAVSKRYVQNLQSSLTALDLTQFDAGLDTVRRAWERGAQIITLGNGGSAMTALHFITDWAKMIPAHSGKPFRGRTLVDNVGMLTAYGNDNSYADIFIEQLKNMMVPGDLVIAISGSGNSNAHGGETLGLCGFSGGKLRQKAKTVIWVNANDMQICEDIHAMFGHVVMQALCGVHKPLTRNPTE
jgi:D-sedoheptulose 7-phosphate isomerase